MKQHTVITHLSYLNVKEMYSSKIISIKDFYSKKYLYNSELEYKFFYLVRTIHRTDTYSIVGYNSGLSLKLPIYKFFINKNYYYLKFIDFFHSLKLTLFYL